MRAIETEYKGCRFRSRLEARWAVFFDSLDIEWLYEPEGFEKVFFEADGVVRYLPDFFLPRTGTWVEVKGRLGVNDAVKMAHMMDWGSPMQGIDDSGDRAGGNGLLLLGDIPKLTGNLCLHPIITHRKGLNRSYCFFSPAGPERLIMQMPSDETFFGLVTGGLTTDDYLDASLYSKGGVNKELDSFFDAEHLSIPTKYIFPSVVKAYRESSSARFEFGEKG